MKRLQNILILFLLAGLCPTESRAAEPDFGFEEAIPSSLRAVESTIDASTQYFKEGRRSLHWHWDAPSAQLILNEPELFAASGKVRGAGVMLWLYREVAGTEPLRFCFESASGEVLRTFDFRLSFVGWRACWMRYVDMEGEGDPAQIARLRLVAPASATRMPKGKKGQKSRANDVWLDRWSISRQPLNDRLTPDAQIPNNNGAVGGRRNPAHWCRLWEWEQWDDRIPQTIVSEEDSKTLKTISRRLDDLVSEGMPKIGALRKKWLPQAHEMLERFEIRRTHTGVIGAPLVSNDEWNASADEVRLRDLETMMWAFAAGYKAGIEGCEENYLLLWEYALDQGFAWGSGMGTNHHYGYSVRKIFEAAWLMRDRLKGSPRWSEIVRTLNYWSGLQEGRQPFDCTRDGVFDTWHTLLVARVVAALMLTDEAERLHSMQLLSTWVSETLRPTPGTLGGLKVDGTAFHHGGFYPAYSVGGFAALGAYCRLTADTKFLPDTEGRGFLKKALLTMATYCHTRDWGLGISGRHPLSKNGRIPEADLDAFAELALAGDLAEGADGSSGVDEELAGAWLRLGGQTPRLKNRIRQAGVSVGATPEGFFVYNYGATGIHRRAGWMVTLKAMNTAVWGSEIYTRDNRFGRYQSYGTVQIMTEPSAVESGYEQKGWDWNCPPAATTVHLPWARLESPRKGTLMQRNAVRYSGVSSLEGRNGMMIFRLQEPDLPNFTGATASQSVFCFDNRILYLGSDISNGATDAPTYTTLFQNILPQRGCEVRLNGAPIDPNREYRAEGEVQVTSPYGELFVVPRGRVVVRMGASASPDDRKRETTRGQTAWAAIEHGCAPTDAGYQYICYIRPDSIQQKHLAERSREYLVLRRDRVVHAVRDLPTGISAYACFEAGTDVGELAKFDGGMLVMHRAEDDDLLLSICTPDLGFESTGYTTDEASRPIEKSLTIKGLWVLSGDASSDVSVAVTPDPIAETTRVVATCVHGQPVEVRLCLIPRGL